MPGTRKLGKTTAQRKAMLRQQVTDFLDNGRMETTSVRRFPSSLVKKLPKRYLIQ